MATTTDHHFKRALKNRHIQMIALGGAMGTGLFYGSADTISLAGPGITLAYTLGGIVIFLIMRALGEMTVHQPVSGSFSHYAHSYWGKFPGFLTGWNYWCTYILVSMAELSVVGTYVNYWFPDIPQWISSLVFLLMFTLVNCINVKAFGEFEFWFALIKVVAILCLIFAGLLVITFGLGFGGHPVGLTNLWKHGGFMPNGIQGLLLSLVMVMFSFGGVELIGITAGEAENPQRSIPKAVNQVVWRVSIFYVGSMIVMMAIFPWNQITHGASPFVQIFSKLGVRSAASILNLVVLTACLSAYNSGLYCNARMIYDLSLQGYAPKAFSKLTKAGIPILGVLFSSLLTLITVILSYIAPKNAFETLASATTVSVIINWASILFTQLKFRKKLSKDEEKSLKFKMPLYPYSSYVSLLFLCLVVVLMAFIPHTRYSLYIAPVWLLGLLIGYKIVQGTKKSNHSLHLNTDKKEYI